MKKFNTLEELKEALMSDEGAVYWEYGGKIRFRIKGRYLERYGIIDNEWLDASRERNQWFIFDLKSWTRYEKPKKIVKESFEGFLTWANYIPQLNESQIAFIISGDLRDEISTLKKATITIEREVEDE